MSSLVRNNGCPIRHVVGGVMAEYLKIKSSLRFLAVGAQ